MSFYADVYLSYSKIKVQCHNGVKYGQQNAVKFAFDADWVFEQFAPCYSPCLFSVARIGLTPLEI